MEVSNNTKMLNDAIKMCKDMIQLFEAGDKTKQNYIKIANSIQMPVPSFIRENEIAEQLQMHMNNTRYIALYHPSNPVTLVAFGIKHLSNVLWKAVNELGIGSLNELYVEHKSLVAKIYIHLGIRKDEKESQEEFKERKKIFFENNKYMYDENKQTNTKHIVNNDKNLEMLLNSLMQLFEIKRYNLDVKNGNIWLMCIYASDVKIPTIKVEEKASNDADIEIAIKEVVNMMDVISFYTNTQWEFKSIDELIELISGQYYCICQNLGCENDFMGEYRNKHLPNREQNLDTNALIDKIGSKISPKEIIEYSWNILQKFEDIIDKKYCMYANNKQMSFYGIKSEMSFLSHDFYSKNGNYRFDSIRSDISEDYVIPHSELDYVRDTLYQENKLEIVNVELKNYDNLFYINKLYCRITSLFEIISLYS